jgi:ferric-dicitrate binding protein FerR (iron transport regulator)
MKEIQSLLSKYKAGIATQDELKQLLQLAEADDPVLKECLKAEYDYDLTTLSKVLSAQRSADIWQKIQAKKTVAAPGKIIHWRWIGWAAASIILIAGGIRLLMPAKNFPAKPLAINTAPAPKTRHVSNPGTSEMRIVLSDQSVVRLEPNSALTWYEDFDSKTREISLSGKAFFKVAKDKTRPFTVYANGIATTALGTQFSVNTLVNDKIEVRLFEGKVKITTSQMKPVYLEPGQAFAINMQLHQYAVSKFENTHEIKEKEIDATAFTFEREPLNNVFEKISARYHVHISYDAKEIERLRFTGTILQTDSLQMVLSVICNMNELAFKQDENKISISKLK